MELTPGQVQSLLELSPEAFRHWKKVLPPIAGRNGYRPCFTLGDLFALAVVKEAVTKSGVRTSSLGNVASDLFEIARVNSWAALERSVISIEPSADSVRLLSDTQMPNFEQVCILLRCRPLIAELRNRLLRGNEEAEQATLNFPPTMVGSPVRREGAA